MADEIIDENNEESSAAQKAQAKTNQKGKGAIDGATKTNSVVFTGVMIAATLALAERKKSLLKSTGHPGTKEDAEKLEKINGNLLEDATKAAGIEEPQIPAEPEADESEELASNPLQESSDPIQELRERTDLTPAQQQERDELVEQYEAELNEFSDKADAAHDHLAQELNDTAEERQKLFSKVITENENNSPSPKPGSHNSDEEEELKAAAQQETLDEKVEKAKELSDKEQHTKLDDQLDVIEEETIIKKYERAAEGLNKKFTLENESTAATLEAQKTAEETAAAENEISNAPTPSPK